MKSVGLIILAAGGSSRMGSPKQLLEYEGSTLIERAVQAATATSCRPIIVVAGADVDAITNECAGLPAQIAVNTDWRDGIGSSIAVGVSALMECDPDSAGVLIILCDQPKVTSAFLTSLVDLFQLQTNELCAAEYDDSVGVPAIFARRFFDDLVALNGDHGAKKLLKANLPLVKRIPFDDAAVDIDTPADYNSLL